MKLCFGLSFCLIPESCAVRLAVVLQCYARSLQAGCGYSKSSGFVLGPPRASFGGPGAFTCLNAFQSSLASAHPSSFGTAVEVRYNQFQDNATLPGSLLSCGVDMAGEECQENPNSTPSLSLLYRQKTGKMLKLPVVFVQD